MNSEDIVFTATNSDRNITVTLREGTPNTFGRQHIIARRPAMNNKLYAIKETIENTQFSITDKDHSDRERLYLLGADKNTPDLYMTVVVEYQDENNGNIITAFPVDNVPKGGTVNYVKNSK